MGLLICTFIIQQISGFVNIVCKKLTSGLFDGIIRPANKVSKILNLRLDEKIGGSPINSKIFENRRRKDFFSSEIREFWRWCIWLHMKRCLHTRW